MGSGIFTLSLSRKHMGMRMRENDINIGITFNFFRCAKLWHFVPKWLWPTSVAQCDSSGPVAKVNYSGLFHIWILKSVENTKIPAIIRQQFLIGFWSTTVILYGNSQKAGSELGLLSHTYKTIFPNMWPGENFPLLPPQILEDLLVLKVAFVWDGYKQCGNPVLHHIKVSPGRGPQRAGPKEANKAKCQIFEYQISPSCSHFYPLFWF